MEFIIGRDESFYFETHGHIEFEGIFTEAEIEKLTTSLEQVLEKRFKTPKEKYYLNKPKEWYCMSRDLWRDSLIVKKVLFNGKLGKVAAQLIHQKGLRLGLDQWIFGGEPLPLKNSLEKSFPFQGIVLGALITLKTFFPSLTDGEAKSSFFPTAPGHITFFKGNLELDFQQNFQASSPYSYLLVIITHAKGLYIFQENDPCMHFLKNLGFGFGDKLTDVDHPFLIR